MQSAETVLGVLRDRGRRGLPCIELYRQMFNINLYLLAYGRIYANQGAMTPGASAETADGMSEDKIEQIIEAMRHERYRFSPARRTFIPKKNGKLRPLGLPTWSDKLAGEVVRLLLEAYYEPTFSGHSHGFRPGKGCHTALREVESTWTGTTWFIEGDISDCFGSLDHEIMVTILSEKIHDNRFLRLIRNMLTAGYLEDWEYHKSCFCCTTCRKPFETASFYVFDDRPYCKRHYHELNNSMCKDCGDGVEGQCLQLEDGTIRHPSCFKCHVKFFSRVN